MLSIDQKIELLSGYVVNGAEEEDFQKYLKQVGPDEDTSKWQDLIKILTGGRFKILDKALNASKDVDVVRSRFARVIDELIILYGQQQEKNKILEKILITNNTALAEYNFMYLRKSISADESLAIFNDLFIQFSNPDYRGGVVEKLVENLCRSTAFNKRSGVGSIKTSLESLIKIISTHSKSDANSEMNFRRLFYEAEYFSREILESYPAEEGFNKMKEFLIFAGFKQDDEHKNCISQFVKNFFKSGAIGGDQEKIQKLNYYLQKAFHDNNQEIFEFKKNIIKDLEANKISYELDKYFPSYKDEYLIFTLGKENHTVEEIHNIIIYLGSIKEAKLRLGDLKINSAILPGDDGDYEFLRKVLKKSNTKLLNELIGESPQLINEDQIFACFNPAVNQPSKPIRDALRYAFENNDPSAQDCLTLLFSKISDHNKLLILDDLIKLNTQDEGQGEGILFQAVEGNFLSNLLARDFDSARILVYLGKKFGLESNIKSSLSYLIDINHKFFSNTNCVELLSMIAKYGKFTVEIMKEGEKTTLELEGAELLVHLLNKENFYENRDSVSKLLGQKNMGALALFFDITGGLFTKENRSLILKIFTYLEKQKQTDLTNNHVCQNLLIFFLEKNNDYKNKLKSNFSSKEKVVSRNLEDYISKDPKKKDEIKLIRAICNSIFLNRKDRDSLADAFQKLEVNPYLLAESIFKHFVENETKERRKTIRLAFGKLGLIRFIGEKDNELSKSLTGLILMRVVGFDVHKYNPLLCKEDFDPLILKLNERLLEFGLNPTRDSKAPNGVASNRGQSQPAVNSVQKTAITPSL
ncbi:hypothetical protein LBMAG18_04580 [Alphaproteobacteria bacterium]|nr:hypothetical protein LBMAG18_04580 [Alphaproteobacteria bacterium]